MPAGSLGTEGGARLTERSNEPAEGRGSNGLPAERVDELVAASKEGDLEAFKDLYAAYFDRIYGYVSVILRDRHEAEDVSQQVFVKAMQGIGGYQGSPGSSFDAWLFRIARNAVMDVMRRSRRVTVEDPATIEVRRAADGESHDAMTQLSRLSDSDVSVFLKRLPDAQRDALVLRFVLGMSAEEVGQAMNRRTEAVRALQSRGLRTLEQRLAAVGRRADRRRRMPTRTRMKPAPVLAARRFALGGPMGQHHLAAFSRRSSS